MASRALLVLLFLSRLSCSIAAPVTAPVAPAGEKATTAKKPGPLGGAAKAAGPMASKGPMNAVAKRLPAEQRKTFYQLVQQKKTSSGDREKRVEVRAARFQTIRRAIAILRAAAAATRCCSDRALGRRSPPHRTASLQVDQKIHALLGPIYAQYRAVMDSLKGTKKAALATNPATAPAAIPAGAGAAAAASPKKKKKSSLGTPAAAAAPAAAAPAAAAGATTPKKKKSKSLLLSSVPPPAAGATPAAAAPTAAKAKGKGLGKGKGKGAKTAGAAPPG